jgi:hypothetical protein
VRDDESVRAHLVASAFGVLVALVACGELLVGSDLPVAGDDAAPDDATTADGGIVRCEPEPAWAFPGGPAPTTATCGGIAGIDLLTTPKHCGRCDHDCGGDPCAGGQCALRDVHRGAPAGPFGQDADFLYYHRGSELHRVRADGTHEALGLIPFDPLADTVTAGIADEERVWVRTQSVLYGMPKVPGSGLAIRTFPVDYQYRSRIASFGAFVYVTDPFLGLIRQIDKTTGETKELVRPAPSAYDAVSAGPRFLWLEQPWFAGTAPTNRLVLREADVNREIYAYGGDAGGLAGLAVDGDDAYVLNRGDDGGGVLHITLGTATATSFAAENVLNSVHNASVAVDATHVYWLLGENTSNYDAFIEKRARCGGEIARIGFAVGSYSVVPFRERLFVFTYEGVFSLAK